MTTPEPEMRRPGHVPLWMVVVVLFTTVIGAASMVGFGFAIRDDVREAQRLARVAETRSDVLATEQRLAVLCSTADVLTANRTQLQTLRDIIDPNGELTPEQASTLQEIDAALRTIKVPDTSDIDCVAALQGAVNARAENGS
jgi:hypothetical protein